MSSKKKRGVQEGQLVKMLERQRVQQAAEDAAKKGVGAPGLYDGCAANSAFKCPGPYA